MTKAERELLVGLAIVVKEMLENEDNSEQWKVSGLLDELEEEDKKQLEEEEELTEHIEK